jgi:mannose-6-phosphate isomerase
MIKINGVVQHYAWGGNGFLSNLLHQPSLSSPAAEYWLGTHPLGEATVAKNNNKLSSYAGELPFLFKILDVEKMLSIQVHPTIPQAVEGFNKENDLGIALNANNRNYKDKNHKPESMIALSDFYLLHGFKSLHKFLEDIEPYPSLATLGKIYNEDGLQAVYTTCMRASQNQLQNWFEPVAHLLMPQHQMGALQKNELAFWFCEAVNTYCANNWDAGLASIFLLNLVCLKPGEGIFQEAGLLHAYLQGQNVEIMANSDNVLRGGLTPKHIDVEELLSIVNYKVIEPKVLLANKQVNNWVEYAPPVSDYTLHNCNLQTSSSKTIPSKSLLFCTSGEASINNETIQQGEAIFFNEATTANFETTQGASLYLAHQHK